MLRHGHWLDPGCSIHLVIQDHVAHFLPIFDQFGDLLRIVHRDGLRSSPPGNGGNPVPRKKVSTRRTCWSSAEARNASRVGVSQSQAMKRPGWPGLSVCGSRPVPRLISVVSCWVPLAGRSGLRRLPGNRDWHMTLRRHPRTGPRPPGK